METQIRVIAHIDTDLPAKFGIPRQSGLVKELKGRIIFEPEFRVKEAFKGLEGFSHIWLLWKFSENKQTEWSPSVKPPRLGGKTKMGVFATRSPFRPSNIGLSCVKLEKIEIDKEYGPVLIVSGADLMNGTPIYDIKPYLAYADSHPDAVDGFADRVKDYALEVIFPDEWLRYIPKEKQAAIIGILAQDPRPAYHDFPERVYGVEYSGFDVRFRVENGILTVCEVEKLTGRFLKKTPE